MFNTIGLKGWFTPGILWNDHKGKEIDYVLGECGLRFLLAHKMRCYLMNRGEMLFFLLYSFDVVYKNFGLYNFIVNLLLNQYTNKVSDAVTTSV